MRKIRNVVSFFNGMSFGSMALHGAGIEHDHYYYGEVDKYANQATEAVSKCLSRDKDIAMGDITKWREWDIDWSTVDLFMGGSPCQGFSSAGKQAGTTAILDGEKIVVDSRELYLELKAKGAEFLSQSFLFWEYVLCLDHVKQCNPDVFFFLENVKMKKEFLDLISDAMGVKPVFINSALVSAQNRQRFYWANWNITEPEDRGILLKDIIEHDVDESFYYAQKSIDYMQRGNEKWKQAGSRRADGYTQDADKEKSFTLTANMHKGVPYNYFQESVKCGAMRGRYIVDGKRGDHLVGSQKGITEQRIEVRKDFKTNCLTTVQKDNLVVKGRAYNRNDGLGKELDKSYSLNASDWRGLNRNQTQTAIASDAQYRKLTPRECMRLQTVPEFIIDALLQAGISNTQLYKMIGNGWTKEVIEHCFLSLPIKVEQQAKADWSLLFDTLEVPEVEHHVFLNQIKALATQYRKTA